MPSKHKSRFVCCGLPPRESITELEAAIEDHSDGVFELLELSKTEATAYAEAFIVCMEIEEMKRDIEKFKSNIH
ncbi:hypothetical protein Gekk315_00051 [Aeromonas phage Gekk3-15]